MAIDRKISELFPAGPLTGADEVPIAQEGSTRRTSMGDISDFVSSSIILDDADSPFTLNSNNKSIRAVIDSTITADFIADIAEGLPIGTGWNFSVDDRSTFNLVVNIPIDEQNGDDDPQNPGNFEQFTVTPGQISSIIKTGADAWEIAIVGGAPIYEPVSDTFFIADKRDGSVLNLGQELIVPCLNPSGSIILDGSVVRFTGWSGDFPTIVLALAGDLTSSSIIGLATTDIQASSAETGKVTLFGEVRGIDTSLLVSNSTIFVDPVTPGAFTTIKPVLNAFIIGVVGKVDVAGSLFANTTQPPIDVSNAVPASGTRVFLTAQQTGGGDPAGAGIFFANTGDPLTGDATTVSPAVPDDSQAVLTEFLNVVRVLPQDFDKGAYSASVLMEVNNTSAEERIRIEVYDAQADGTAIDPGSGLPNGTEGVPPILVVDSGIINMANTAIAIRVPLIGSAPVAYIGPIGNRTKYVVVVAKEGAAGGDKTFTLHHGENNPSFVNLPLVIEMGDLGDVDDTGIVDGEILVRNGAQYLPGDAENINATTNNNTLVTFKVQSQIDELDVKDGDTNERIDNLELSQSTFVGGEFFLQSDDVIVNAETFNAFTTSAPDGAEEVSTNSDTTPSQENLITQFITDPFDIETTFVEGNWSFNFFLSINNSQGTNELRIKVRKMTADPGFLKSDIDTVTKVIDFSGNNNVEFEVIQKEIAEFTLLEGEFLIVEVYAFSDNARTWSLFYDGISRQSKVSIPAAGFHNDLLGIQGGQVGERFHLTAAELASIAGAASNVGAQVAQFFSSGPQTAAAFETIIADTSGGAFTVNLPATPSQGDFVSFEVGSDYSVDNLTIGRNGETIMGDAADLVISTLNPIALRYNGVDWRIA